MILLLPYWKYFKTKFESLIQDEIFYPWNADFMLKSGNVLDETKFSCSFNAIYFYINGNIFK